LLELISAACRHDLDWQFIFLGCDAQSIKDANAIGIPCDRAFRYKRTHEGTSQAFTAMGH